MPRPGSFTPTVSARSSTTDFELVIMMRTTHDDSGLDALPDNIELRDARYFRAILAAGKELTRAEQILRAAVADARRAGDSWAVIGAALGVTRQAAHERFRSVEHE